MRTLKSLFDNNRKWAAEVLQRDPKFFEELASLLSDLDLCIATPNEVSKMIAAALGSA